MQQIIDFPYIYTGNHSILLWCNHNQNLIEFFEMDLHELLVIYIDWMIVYKPGQTA